jgi:predicted nucleic acid-binding protein
MNGILDTSVLIAIEQGRPLDVQRLPDTAGLSVATLAATAHAHGVAVYTQDADFDHLPVDVVRV